MKSDGFEEKQFYDFSFIKIFFRIFISFFIFIFFFIFILN
jgi:hypothetical protein